MISDEKTTFWQVAFTHFVPCFFLGVISLYCLRAMLSEMALSRLVDNTLQGTDIAVGTINGAFVAVIVLFFHWQRNYRHRTGRSLFVFQTNGRTIAYGMVVGFMAGAFDILFGLHNEGIIILTLIVLFLLLWHLRIFTRSVVDMLKPGSHATWREVSELLRIYLTMLAGFTLVNATLEVGHMLAGTTLPFDFGRADGELFLNSLYYTVVTMTTLGYGDFVPRTGDAKLLLVFQCLISYAMFALMIGIITRGVANVKTPTDDGNE